MHNTVETRGKCISRGRRSRRDVLWFNAGVFGDLQGILSRAKSEPPFQRIVRWSQPFDSNRLCTERRDPLRTCCYQAGMDNAWLASESWPQWRRFMRKVKGKEKGIFFKQKVQMPTCDDGPAVGRRKERGCNCLRQQPSHAQGSHRSRKERERERGLDSSKIRFYLPWSYLIPIIEASAC